MREFERHHFQVSLYLCSLSYFWDAFLLATLEKGKKEKERERKKEKKKERERKKEIKKERKRERERNKERKREREREFQKTLIFLYLDMKTFYLPSTY